MKLRILRAASDEFAAAVEWYEGCRRGLGAEFFLATSETIDRVAQNPEIGGRGLSRTRRIPMRRFPYQVVYYVASNDVVVVAIAHMKRRPNYWKRRK